MGYIYYKSTGDYSVGPQTTWHNYIHKIDTDKILNKYRLPNKKYRYPETVSEDQFWVKYYKSTGDYSVGPAVTKFKE